MDFINNPNFKLSNVLKVGGIAIVVIIIISFVVNLLGTSVSSLVYNDKQTSSSRSIAPTADYGYGYDEVYEESLSAGKVAQDLSIRNVASEPYSPYSAGNDAEAFEVTDYSATIEARNLESTCL